MEIAGGEGLLKKEGGIPNKRLFLSERDAHSTKYTTFKTAFILCKI